jgi:hypothetical protein
MPALGYSLDHSRQFEREGRVVMEKGNTRLLTFSR